MSDFRIERDSLGEVRVPSWALWGAQTQRAFENFKISGIKFPRVFIKAIGFVKLCSAIVNRELGKLDGRIADAIIRAAREVIEGKWDDHFPLDIFQTGSGTSTNMNANEVIANRACEILGGKRGDKTLVHPNDHVNLGQSSNDVIPSCIHISASLALRDKLMPALSNLHKVLSEKSSEFDDIIKTGRTHLMDAMPVRLGQEFSGYAGQIYMDIERIKSIMPRLYELAIGGTAVGTGVNTHPEFGKRVAEAISKETGIPFRETGNHFSAQSSMDTAVELSGALKTLAVSLYKIANDIRWMNSGPQAGLAEIQLPSLQPGSSIMPGKVNPVIPEAVMMVAMQVIGNDTAITLAGASGNFELNVSLPIIAHNLIQSIEILGNACDIFVGKCIVGIVPDRKRMERIAGQNAILATILTPYIGYDKASEIVKRAIEGGKTVRDVVIEMKLFKDEDVDKIFDIRKMT